MTRSFRPLVAAICIAGFAALAAPAAALAAAATHFEFTVPTTVSAGTPFSFTVSAVDNSNAIDTSYNGTVSFSSDDPTATLPTAQKLTNGTKTFTNGATLNAPGCRRITASDGTIATSSPDIGVNGCNVVDVQTGSLTAQDPKQTGRLAYTPPAGQCNTTLTGALASSTGLRAYDAYTHANLANNPICVTVDVTPAAAGCENGAISNASYLSSFDPANPLTNYASDPGTSSGRIGQSASESYTVPPGGTFVDVVHATNPGGTCSSYFYELSANKPFPLTLPTATGTPAVGNVLGWDTGQWSDSPTFSYQWLRCDTSGGGCAEIPGATSGTYPVTDADAGHTLRIRVAGADGLGTSTADSPPTAVVPAGAALGATGTSAAGKRAAALKKCKKIKNKKKRRKCVEHAKRLPV